MADYSKLETDRFTCHICGQNRMYPNFCDSKIMGFACANCGEVNYPTRDKLKNAKWYKRVSNDHGNAE